MKSLADMQPRSSRGGREQLGGQVNLGSSQRLGNRTVLLAIKRNCLECRIVYARNVGFSLELNAGDRKRPSNFVQFDVSDGMNATLPDSRLGKLRDQCDGEAAGMSGARRRIAELLRSFTTLLREAPLTCRDAVCASGPDSD